MPYAKIVPFLLYAPHAIVLFCLGNELNLCLLSLSQKVTVPSAPVVAKVPDTG